MPKPPPVDLEYRITLKVDVVVRVEAASHAEAVRAAEAEAEHLLDGETVDWLEFGNRVTDVKVGQIETE